MSRPTRHSHYLFLRTIVLAALVFPMLSGVLRGEVATIRAMVPPPVHALAFPAGGRSPAGVVLGVNDRTFTRDGRPWFPVMGEFHYARYPAGEWERELLKMKAGGVTIVSTYVFWIFHEERRGVFDWRGRRDLRRFVELCAKHGMLVWLRVGPWDHGEVRNGGFPDWILEERTRTNDPAYLANVRGFFAQIGRQVRGLLWKDGGPIVGVQLENEYRAGKGGVAHMETLLNLARTAGLDAPFYSATGWDRAVVPGTGFLPVFGGYSAQFWSSSRQVLPPNPNFFFDSIRAEDNVGADLKPKDPAYQSRYAGYPFLTAEMGGGMATAYHRRPVVSALDVVAPEYVKVGSGVALLGTYMYHGGTNPDAGEPMAESLSSWHGANDLEEKSYDFQAPLGEFGQVRESYRWMRMLNLFLADFGDRIAPMVTDYPAARPTGLGDRMTPRVAFRGDGEAGFLFINTYQRHYPLPGLAGFQAKLELKSGTLLIPAKPVDVPAGTCLFWPVNFDLEGVRLVYATAEPVCRLRAEHVFVFAAQPGIPVEFAFPREGAMVTAPCGQVDIRGDRRVVGDLRPGRGVAVVVRRVGKPDLRIVVLSREDALNLAKLDIGGAERLCLSPAETFGDGPVLHLSSNQPTGLRVALFPAPSAPPAGFRALGREGLFSEYVAEVKANPRPRPEVTLLREAGPAPEVRMNPNPKRRIPLAPPSSAFSQAAVWHVGLPAAVIASPGRTLLRIRYVGDVARLYAGDRLVEDNDYKGTPLEFGLWRLTEAERRDGLTLRVLPLRKDAPIYFPRDAWPDFGTRTQLASLGRVSLVVRYEALMNLAP
ncbi:beta-galactosidase precursor [mine drainage metagenome]|uniref:Beta-galactosidase n=1 Tax=mine drainage metagenome TaxID=410659 RepID=A0A1J5S5F2_9ZZZZ